MRGAAERYVCEGQPLRLGRRIGRGGEGEVFAVARDPARAVKLYTAEGAPAREAKIAAMLRAGLAEAAPLVAFPLAEVRSEGGRFAGFVMPRVAEAEPLHELYAPGARKRLFPEADYRFIVRAATNTARAVAAAHGAGVVIGDVNHSGLLIGQDAIVHLIDADSFQIADGYTLHLCRVGVAEYTPPELQGLALAETPRTADHDAFGLAVLLFQLLFLGRHPFAGVTSGEPPPVSEAIAAHAFAYDRHRRTALAAPPAALHLDEVPADVAALFERAFAPDGAGRRPTAAAWADALAAFEAAIAPCPAAARHVHAAPACPWCRIERITRAPLFPAPGEVGAAPVPLSREEALRRLAAIVLPEAVAYVPPLPLPSSAPPPPTAKQLWFNRAFTGMVAVMMVCAVGLVTVSPQNFLMASPICLYGIGPVGDALMPRRAARRALRKLDGQIADAIASVQARADLDAAVLLKADLERRAAALPGPAVRRPTPRQRAEAMRLARDMPRLETMAKGLIELLASRDLRLDRMLARREQLVADLEARGEAAAAFPAVAPRGLRESTRRALERPAPVSA